MPLLNQATKKCCHPTVLQPPQVGQFIFAIVRYSRASSLALFPSSDCATVQLEKDERTALHRTVYYEKIDIIDYLMYQCHMNVDIVNKFGDTPLHDACYYGKTTALKTMIKHKPNPNLASEKDQKPLDSANFSPSRKKKECIQIIQEYLHHYELQQDYEQIKHQESILRQILARIKHKKQKFCNYDNLNQRRQMLSKRKDRYEKEIADLEKQIEKVNQEMQRLDHSLIPYDTLVKEIEGLSAQSLTNFEPHPDKIEVLLHNTDCPVCCLSMRPPTKIYQCHNGHHYCYYCEQQTWPKKCPHCRDDLLGSQIRCLAMENLMRQRFRNQPDVPREIPVPTP